MGIWLRECARTIENISRIRIPETLVNNIPPGRCVGLSVSLFACMPVSLSVCPSVCLSVCLCASRFQDIESRILNLGKCLGLRCVQIRLFSRFQDSKISRFQDFKTSRFQDFKISRFSRLQDFQDFKIFNISRFSRFQDFDSLQDFKMFMIFKISRFRAPPKS